jgi:hypothetical protein
MHKERERFLYLPININLGEFYILKGKACYLNLVNFMVF